MNGHAVCMIHQLKQFYIFQYVFIKYTYIILYCQSLTWPNGGTPTSYMYVVVYSIYWYFGLTMSPLMIKKKKSTKAPQMTKNVLFVRLTYESAIFLYKIKTHIFFSGFFFCVFWGVLGFFFFFFSFLLLLGLVDYRSWWLSKINLGKAFYLQLLILSFFD